MAGRPNNPWGGGFDPANNPLGGGSMPNGGSFPSFGGGATPPQFTGGLPGGGDMGAPLGGQPGGGGMGLPGPGPGGPMGGPGPMNRPMLGQGAGQGRVRVARCRWLSHSVRDSRWAVLAPCNVRCRAAP
jgi:hypothetical protein